MCSSRALLHDANYVGEYWNVSITVGLLLLKTNIFAKIIDPSEILSTLVDTVFINHK
jgi:hypothetical protein